MSLISTYVRATDGKMYRNPTLAGEGWFICFDDDDDPELVIKIESKLSPEHVFKEIGMEVTKLRFHSVMGRLFGKEEDDFNFDDANCYFFWLRNRINPQFIEKHDGTIDEPEDAHEGDFYDFKE